MPPTFNESSFKFHEGEKVPAHDEGWSGRVERREDLWHIDGLDTFEGESYTVASNIESLEEAELLAKAHRRRIEEHQPAVSSGGQSLHGIQDRTYIVDPGGTKRYVSGSLD